MTESYLKDIANELNKVFQLYKQKIMNLPKRAETDEERDNVAEWFGETITQFDRLSKPLTDKDVANFVARFSVACCMDLSDKYEGTLMNCSYHWLGKNFTLEEFGEYLDHCEKGDSFKVNGITLEVKRLK